MNTINIIWVIRLLFLPSTLSMNTQGWSIRLDDTVFGTTPGPALVWLPEQVRLCVCVCVIFMHMQNMYIFDWSISIDWKKMTHEHRGVRRLDAILLDFQQSRPLQHLCVRRNETCKSTWFQFLWRPGTILPDTLKLKEKPQNKTFLGSLDLVVLSELRGGYGSPSTHPGVRFHPGHRPRVHRPRDRSDTS